jgi:hypothetical protein
MNRNFFLCSSLLLCSFSLNLSLLVESVYGIENTNQNLMDQISEKNNYKNKDSKKNLKHDPFLTNAENESELNDNYIGTKIEDKNSSNSMDRPDFSISDNKNDETKEYYNKKNKSLKSEIKSPGGHLPDSIVKDDNYFKYQIEEKIRKSTEGNQFVLFIGKDNYSYKNRENNFNKIFRDSKQSKIPLFLGINYKNPWWRTLLGDFGWSFGGMLGLNQGKAQFKDGQQSNFTISLWRSPLDLGILYNLPLFNSLLNLNFQFGPSLLFLFQNRSDVSYTQKKVKKNVYEIGRGYFWEASFSINLSIFSKSDTRKFFNQYDVGQYYLTVLTRGEKYKKFYDDKLEVFGVTSGLGITYEFL